MKTDSDFEKCIMKEPDNRTRIKIYADWLMEQNNVNRFGALRQAVRGPRGARQANEITRAGNLLGERSWLRRPLMVHIMHYVGFTEALNFAVAILPGSRPPTFNNPDVKFSNVIDGHQIVYIGARWILAVAKLVQEQAEQAERHGVEATRVS